MVPVQWDSGHEQRVTPEAVRLRLPRTENGDGRGWRADLGTFDLLPMVKATPRSMADEAV